MVKLIHISGVIENKKRKSSCLDYIKSLNNVPYKLRRMISIFVELSTISHVNCASKSNIVVMNIWDLEEL